MVGLLDGFICPYVRKPIFSVLIIFMNRVWYQYFMLKWSNESIHRRVQVKLKAEESDEKDMK